MYYFTLDLATLDGMLPQRIDDSVVREANRRLTPSHARNIQQYLEERDDWLLGSLLLGIAPDAVVFKPHEDDDGNEISPNFGRAAHPDQPGQHDADIRWAAPPPGHTGNPGPT